MTTDPFTTAARTEAEEYAWDRNAGTTHEDSLDRDAFASGYEYGAVWARDHLAAQEATDAEVEAAGRVILACIWNGSEEDAPQDVIAYAWDQARAALSDARAARRDEKDTP